MPARTLACGGAGGWGFGNRLRLRVRHRESHGSVRVTLAGDLRFVRRAGHHGSARTPGSGQDNWLRIFCRQRPGRVRNTLTRGPSRRPGTSEEVKLRIARHLRPGHHPDRRRRSCHVGQRRNVLRQGPDRRRRPWSRGNSFSSRRPTAEPHQPSGLVGVHGHERPGHGQWAQLGSVW